MTERLPGRHNPMRRHNPMGRRDLMRLGALGLAASALGVSGCTAAESTRPWHAGRIFIATGNTTGVYYQMGGGYADLIDRYLPGYEARAEPTGASGENIQRVASGDMDIAFTLADTAADAIGGSGAFAGNPQQIRALARVYRNYTHLVARADAGIATLADLRNKRVSTGSPNSGTDAMAGRLLAASGIDAEHGINRLRLSLPETTRGLRAGTIDAMFFSGGLPTPGIADLISSDVNRFVLLPTVSALAPLSTTYGGVYGEAAIGSTVYGTPADTPTIAVANLLVVSPTVPEQLAYDLTRVLFEHRPELTQAHPEAANLDLATAADTDPVPLHPGAARFLAKR